MALINATFTNPAIVRVDGIDAVWFLAGVEDVDGTALERLIRSGEGAAFCSVHVGTFVLSIRTGANPRVTAWRARFSPHELFFAVRPNGTIVVSDHFRNVVAALPVHERTTSDGIIAEHHLTRMVFGERTYLSSVSRMGHATQLDIDPRTGATDTRVFDRISATTQRRSRAEYVSTVGRLLTDALGRIPDPASTGLMFSGGVDSTLLLALSPTAIQPVTFVPDSPEFGPETDYARRAAALLGTGIDEVPMPEASFVNMLERTTDTQAYPVFDDAQPFFHQTITETPYRSFVFGLGADSSFGMSLRLARFSNWFSRVPLRQAVAGLTPPSGGGHIGYRLRQVSFRADGLARDPFDPDGFAGNWRVSGETSVFRATFGRDLTRTVKESQISYVVDRMDGVGFHPSRFLSHLELSHWMTVYDNASLDPRAVTNATGRITLCPFEDAAVLDELTTIPLEERYIIGLRAKWILKDLLKQKLPSYPIDQRKKATALPWERYYTDGPLSEIWDRYEVPDAFEGDTRRSLISMPTMTTWTAISYAVWDARIRRNHSLEPHPAVTELSVDPP